ARKPWSAKPASQQAGGRQAAPPLRAAARSAPGRPHLRLHHEHGRRSRGGTVAARTTKAQPPAQRGLASAMPRWVVPRP
ncbi:hypothetical protein CSC81_17425, partial [Tenacibaculum discolor]